MAGSGLRSLPPQYGAEVATSSNSMPDPDPSPVPDAKRQNVADEHIAAFFLKGRAAYLRESFGLPERTWRALTEKAIGKAISHLRGESWHLAREGILQRLTSERAAWLLRQTRHGHPPEPDT